MVAKKKLVQEIETAKTDKNNKETENCTFKPVIKTTYKSTRKEEK